MRRTLLAAFALLMLLLVPTGARAAWGPGSECTTAKHCYALAEVHNPDKSLIFEVRTDAVGLPSTGGFITQEGWVEDNTERRAWDEIGTIYEAGLRAFDAYSNGSAFYSRWLGTRQLGLYNWYGIYDNGAYVATGLTEAGTPMWKRESLELHGLPSGGFQEAQVGTEVASNAEPITDIGREAMAISNDAVPDERWWIEPSLVNYRTTGGEIGLALNSEAPRNGNIEWERTPHAATATGRAATIKKVGPGLTVHEGNLSINNPRPPGVAKAKGRYRATVGNQAGEVVAECIGPRRPATEESVLQGGCG